MNYTHHYQLHRTIVLLKRYVICLKNKQINILYQVDKVPNTVAQILEIWIEYTFVVRNKQND